MQACINLHIFIVAQHR